MADSTPAVATPALTDTAASTQSTCSTPLERLMALQEKAVPMLTEACQAVRANEEARLAALSLGQVSGTIRNGTSNLGWHCSSIQGIPLSLFEW